MTKNLKWTRRLAIMTPFLVFVVIFLSGGGHGYFEPMIFLFPFSTVSIVLFGEITLPFVIIALIQYPIYGLLIDRAKHKNRAMIVGIILMLIHFVVGLLTYVFLPGNF